MQSKSENIYVFGNDWGLYVDIENQKNQMNEMILKPPYLDKYYQNVDSFLNVYKTLTGLLFIC